MQDKEQDKIEELVAVTAPVREYIKKSYDLMCEVRVTAYGADVLRRETGTGVIDEDEE